MIPPLLITLVLGLCYARTMAPDYTWAHFGADGGDLIAAVTTGGVPHPSGYPLYLILARGFQFMPIGTLAFRTNLFSAVCTIGTALLVYILLAREFNTKSMGKTSAAISALAYGLAPFVWGQALVTEVYALHGFLMAGCLHVISAERDGIKDGIRGLVFGLAAANHLSSIMLFPLLAMDYERNTFASVNVLFTRVLGIMAGLSLYLTLPLRASFSPPVNWGDASTLDGFFWLISGQLYRPYAFGLSLADMVLRLRAFAGLLPAQYTWAGIFLALYGLLSSPRRRILIPTAWIGAGYLLFSIFYASRDSQVNLLPVWLCFALWLGHGLQDLFAWLQNRPSLQRAFAGLLFAALALRIPFTLPSVDASQDTRAMDFINRAMDEIPSNAIVIASGDEQIFALWYAHFALAERPDMAVIAEGLVPYDWYIKSLQHTYPSLGLNEITEFPLFDAIVADPSLAVCYIPPDGSIKCR